ncbi:hypothetical protein ABB37_02015 [Leptomonas pyrrhocoris]|uniref:Leucine-rich repeat protein (LRRP) n=1 Tax=Leptomonas pyrrhocoris TaxID=157538 RepID=A0A0M9G7A4_LEPPY|nr:hypothetical protein ABB37_02015 [Leptomonas pyrrhocoris]XP_015662235.1 hypothetical protein ABB37_02015 [Leptomonas pyrrhocoris]KPA83795.1 hypothetical protein ABB37_02015 [Leptomonas pyrrhocoris]KPA83796.1 hypothetical protein ABB37_02015 [Leptomonas pyrrhocoris]|eukprot:XP_015662234.1 hypothetical protein ABB37_02015 [Leptomonas pyrrhocoris]
MGGASSKERFERAATTGTLTVDDKRMRSWSRLMKGLVSLPKLRSMTVSGTRLDAPIPPSFVKLSLWSSLAYLDLSHNRLTCVCALGGVACLSKTHAKHAEDFIRQSSDAPAPSSADPLPLESLNLSGNVLHLLPPFLSRRFPRLRRLVCADNAQPLVIPFSLTHCLGVSASLEALDLRSNGLEKFTVAEDTVESPFEALRELLLDHNELGGTLTLGLKGDKAFPILPSLKRLSVEDQQGKQPLQAVDPTIFVHCPGLNSLSLRGNRNEEQIRAALGALDVYRRWQERNADIINKKIGAGGSAELMR